MLCFFKYPTRYAMLNDGNVWPKVLPLKNSRGEFINNRELVLKLIKKRPSYRGCEVVFSELKEYEVSYGAASMFLERLFKIPGVDKSSGSDLTWEKIMDLRSEKRSC